MAFRKILTTSNKGAKVTYKPKTSQIASQQQGGVCRTMVLTWISNAQMGVAMNNMGGVITGGGFAQIEFRNQAMKIRMGYAQRDDKDVDDAKQAVEKDILHSFSLERDGEPLTFQTVLAGITLDPKNMEANAQAYTMLTLWGNSGHALGLAFHIGGFHYFLDPNRGLFEYDTLEEMLGPLGHVTDYILTNYAHKYPEAMLEQFHLFR